MDLSQTTLFQMFEKRFAHTAQRQRILSQNMANLNTPGYNASDLKPLEFKNELKRTSDLTPVATSPKHLSGVKGQQAFRAESDRNPEDPLISENGVALEDQLMKMSEASGMHALVTTLYAKQTDMVKLSIQKPK